MFHFLKIVSLKILLFFPSFSMKQSYMLTTKINSAVNNWVLFIKRWINYINGWFIGDEEYFNATF